MYFLQAQRYSDLLEGVLWRSEDGIKMIPQLYIVPGDKVGYNQIVGLLFPSDLIFQCLSLID